MEIIFEFLVQFIFEIFGELIARGFKYLRRESPAFNLISILFGYGLLAALFGSFSFLISQHHFIQNPNLRLINLFATPTLIGALMHIRGKFLKKRSKSPIAIDSFGFGFYFAFIFGLIRFFFAN